MNYRNSNKLKKTALILLVISTSFWLGFAFKTITAKQTKQQAQIRKVTGIGGVFFKSKDPKRVREWYQRHLGLNVNDYGAVFEWRQGADTTKKGFTQWSPFAEKSKYFEPSKKDFMINYRVEDLEALVGQLKKEGVIITDKIETFDYGKFVHILDVEGNKIELWEPNDFEYQELVEQMGSK